MVFSSNIFIFIFMPITILLYRLFDVKYRNAFLFLISLLFYSFSGMNGLTMILILFIFNYLMSYFIHKFRNKIVLFLSVGVNVGVLIYSKYVNYLIENINQYFQLNISLLEVLVPLGISFVVFSMISYNIDIYRDDNLFDKNIINVGTYFFLFTKVLQGPIILYKDFKKQLSNKKYDFDFFITGVEKFMIGLSKKVIIADTLTTLVNSLMTQMNEGGIDLLSHWLILISYTFAIYFDWSGYSDMAIGLSRMLGFDFSENFNFPYLSTSISEFWRRWHISLGNFFKQYIYFPLGGSRKGNVYFNLLVVFITTGIWHGAGLLCLAWGLMHGIATVIERILISYGIFEKIPKTIRWIYTMIIVSFGWMIFLMPNGYVLIEFLKGMFINNTSTVTFTIQYYLNSKIIFILIISIIGALVFSDKKLELINSKCSESSLCLTIKYMILLLLTLCSLMMIMSGTYSPFIYFQF